MNLQTKIPLKPNSHNQIDYNSKLVLLGSCFSENMGRKFEYFKFQKFQNPVGILFHPLAIETLITNAINQKTYTDKDVFLNNEQWHCYDVHSQMSHVSKDQLLQDLNNKITETHQRLKDASHLVITLGTAWVYRFLETNTVVANCHKVPQNKFVKELLSVEQISESLNTMTTLLKGINSNLNIMFTVSPVRHIKDGFIENTHSKAKLIVAIHELIKAKSLSTIESYFPSYEIMMDELRDYRFYNEDMLHPSQLAINYIWERFVAVNISKETQQVMRSVDAIQKSISHRSFNPESKAHQLFLKELNAKKKAVSAQFPHLEF